MLEELKNKINAYFTEKYEVEETTIIPSTDYSKLTFGNKGLTSEFCFLFVDIRKSSKIHEVYGFANAARIYQSFHDINVRVIDKNEGSVRAFDGDRIMGVFAGDSKNTNAVRSSMQIQWAIRNLLNKYLDVKLNIGIGIDFGKILITKVGKGRDPNNNDLVWVGQACNYASHYCQEANNTIIISEKTYNAMNESVKYSSNTKEKNMWNRKIISLKNNQDIICYETTWHWEIN